MANKTLKRQNAKTAKHRLQDEIDKRRGYVTYDIPLSIKICERLMRGETLASICARKGYPPRSRIMSWLADPDLKEFHERYYAARRIYAECKIDDMFEMLEDTEEIWEEVTNSKGEFVRYRPNHHHVHSKKLIADKTTWYAEKMVPKLYGKQGTVELDVAGDLKDLLRAASNSGHDLPPPIEGKIIDGE